MRKALWCLCWVLERLCCLTHPFVRVEIKLTGRNCNINLLGVWLSDRFKLGYWPD